MEEICGKKFADPENPCWSPCAPAPSASMPGMMDTILNLGLNDVVVEGWPSSPTTPASPTTPTL